MMLPLQIWEERLFPASLQTGECWRVHPMSALPTIAFGYAMGTGSGSGSGTGPGPGTVITPNLTSFDKMTTWATTRRLYGVL
jgi:hypothetical protein